MNTRGHIWKVGEQAVDAERPELLELRLRASVVRRRLELLVDPGVDLDQQVCRVSSPRSACGSVGGTAAAAGAR
jgi:hypothetical protein